MGCVEQAVYELTGIFRRFRDKSVAQPRLCPRAELLDSAAVTPHRPYNERNSSSRQPAPYHDYDIWTGL